MAVEAAEATEASSALQVEVFLGQALLQVPRAAFSDHQAPAVVHLARPAPAEGSSAPPPEWECSVPHHPEATPLIWMFPIVSSFDALFLLQECFSIKHDERTGGTGGIPNAQEAQLICMELARRMEDLNKVCACFFSFAAAISMYPSRGAI